MKKNEQNWAKILYPSYSDLIRLLNFHEYLCIHPATSPISINSTHFWSFLYLRGTILPKVTNTIYFQSLAFLASIHNCFPYISSSIKKNCPTSISFKYTSLPPHRKVLEYLYQCSCRLHQTKHYQRLCPDPFQKDTIL